MKRLFITMMLVTAVQFVSKAQDDFLPYHKGDICEKDIPTGISPNYFGPNAFPVPDMVKNTTDNLELQLNGTAAFGHLAPTMDKTFTIDFKVRVPLWTERANLTIWGQMNEWYWDTPEVRQMRRVSPDEPLVDVSPGDIYFSLDLRLLNERKYLPCVVFRGACKTATGHYYERARYYDCPGYFFDLCASKNIPVGNAKINIAGCFGFLCWQVDNGRQNDATMYGLALGFYSKYVNLNTDFGGYSGWKHDGDHPMTLKVKADILPEKMLTPFVEYQHGFRDWPFDQVKVGVRCSLDILRK